jgi:hypothetical protein
MAERVEGHYRSPSQEIGKEEIMSKAKLKEAAGTDVAVRASNPVAVAAAPSYLDGYRGRLGTEDIGSDEINIPRLKLGQDMSKEVQGGDIERGDLFLNVSGEIIVPAGEKLPFTVIKRYREFILWRPQKDGGGILARAHATNTPEGVRYVWDKPNSSFDVKVEGKVKVTWTIGKYVDELTVDGPDGTKISIADWGSEIPGDKESNKAATEHHNYVVALPTRDNLVAALSLSRTASPKAKDFNALLKMSSKPMVSRLFTVETVDDSRDGHDFKNYKFRPNKDAYEGVTDGNPLFVTGALFDFYSDMAQSFEGKSVTVDQTDGGDAPAVDERA